MTPLHKIIRRYKRKAVTGLNQYGATRATIAAQARTQPLELLIVRQANDDWVGTNRGSRITFVQEPLVRKADRVFTMGSCFAVEIRKALTARGFDTYPKYAEIEFDPETQKLAKLPARDNLNHYNTFVIRQEFELALEGGEYKPEDLVDLGEQKNLPTNFKALRWQDPYRKMIFASDRASIVALSGKVSQCIGNAIHSADVYVITLGLTEVWRNNANGLYVNQAPKDISDRFTFVESTYEQNYENMSRVCALMAKHYPDRRIILTVSPVPLTRTFTGRDVVVANTESKCTLRAVAGRISKEFSNVTYWPSYEIALARDLFLEDGRHVRPDGVDLIVDQFLAVHVTP